VHTIDYALRMLHPFMPFITEEIWQKIPHDGNSIMMQPFPAPRSARENPEAAQRMLDLMELIGEIRGLRAEMNVDPKRALDAVLIIRSLENKNLVIESMPKIRSLARLNTIEFSDTLSGRLLRGVSKLGEFGLDVHDAINVEAERERLNKETVRVKDEIDKVLKKLNSQDFVSRAPEEVVLDIRTRHSELLEKLRKLESNLSHLPLN
jgi:valyl-tRNA synthetase